MTARPADPAWFHTDSALTRLRWQHGWTDAGGPDFTPPVQDAGHATAVTKLVKAVGLEAAAWVRQVHGGTVLRVDTAGCVGEADALWTDRPGLGVVGRSADCPLVLVGGPRRDAGFAWGFAHASWRSTIARITARLTTALGEVTDPACLTAVICPAAGPCCYEVGPEVRDRAVTALGPAAAACFAPSGASDRCIFDLWSANRQQLLDAGLPAQNVRLSRICTICGGDTWPSYRRQGAAAGRFAAIIGRTER